MTKIEATHCTRKSCATVALFGLIFIGLFQTIWAAPSPAFVANDRWIAVGDSITQRGTYANYVELFQVIRFPDRPLAYVNAGISGDSAQGALRRFDWDILPANAPVPTVATVMFGMNDCDRDLYAPNSPDDEAAQAKRQMRIDNFGKNLNDLVERLRARNIRVVLLTPSPFDDSSTMDSPNLPGVNSALFACAEVARAIAAKHDLAVIDFHGPLTALMRRLQATDPTSSIIGRDRVHPGNPGNFAMAYQFLRAQQPAGAFTQVHLRADPVAVRFVRGATITELTNDATNGLRFTYLAASLPYPVPESAQPGLAWVPFNEDLNREDFLITGLTASRYTLTIDDQVIGEFTATNLASGLDLAALKTPQRRQAESVLAILERRWAELAKLRLLAFMENGPSSTLPQPITLEAMEPSLVAMEQKIALDPKSWLAKHPGNYRLWKPAVTTIQADAEKLLDEARTAAQPKPRRITLTPLPPTS